MCGESNFPDVETASERYASRFDGAVGTWFLSVQDRAIESLLEGRVSGPLDILEIGGAHGQLTDGLLAAGHRVSVHASRRSALVRHQKRIPDGFGRLNRFASSLWDLPCPDHSFDLVIGVRLLAHVERWQELVSEVARVSKRFVILEYPPLESANLLTPLLFPVKRRVERDTRSYSCYWTHRVKSRLRVEGFEPLAVYREFAIPMVAHRALGNMRVSRMVEGFFRSIGLTRLLGSPSILIAARAEERADR